MAEPVERQVYRSLRLSLMSGLIAPGATLTSRSLATELGVSAQPVRDALKRLEADGVLESRPQSGFWLRTPSAPEYLELLEIRQRLEGLAARYAAASIDRRTIDHLRRINARMAEPGPPKHYFTENFRFHFTVYAAAERPNLIALIENLWIRIGPALTHYPIAVDNQSTQRKHKAIIAALAAHDGDAAEAAVADDLGSAASQIVPLLQRQPAASGGEESFGLGPNFLD